MLRLSEETIEEAIVMANDGIKDNESKRIVEGVNHGQKKEVQNSENIQKRDGNVYDPEPQSSGVAHPPQRR